MPPVDVDRFSGALLRRDLVAGGRRRRHSGDKYALPALAAKGQPKQSRLSAFTAVDPVPIRFGQEPGRARAAMLTDIAVFFPRETTVG